MGFTLARTTGPYGASGSMRRRTFTLELNPKQYSTSGSKYVQDKNTVNVLIMVTSHPVIQPYINSIVNTCTNIMIARILYQMRFFLNIQTVMEHNP